MTTISATPILASKHAVTGDVLTTLLLRYPRIIHSEFMTHRKFSKCSASSRAIPVKKLIEDVETNPFAPVVWTKNEPGMQGREELTGDHLSAAKIQWSAALGDALYRARQLANTGAHKQIVNRLLEPFSHITVVCSSTDWSNFLALRDHPDAEPHMQVLAREVRKALDNAEVQELQPGEWHLPFVSALESEFHSVEECKMLSVARCASASYKTVDGFDMTLARAANIYIKLRESDPIHASPFEHVAQADEYTRWSIDGDAMPKHRSQHRNFTGFRQLRAMVEDGHD